MNCVLQLGEGNQNEILNLANQTKRFSQSYVSMILNQLEKRKLIKAKLSHVGHEKRYSLHDASEVEDTPVQKIIQRPSVMYPTQAPQIRDRDTYSAQSHFGGGLFNSVQPAMFNQVQNENAPLIYENGKLRKS